jgi:predicted ATPase
VGLREAAEHTTRDILRAVLRDKDLLLVLDNCEQVSAAAPPVADLVAGAPGVRVLATSRVRLSVGGERVYSVESLRVPTPVVVADLLPAGG